MRHNEPVFKTLNLSLDNEIEVLEAMVKEPILMQRPIITDGKKVVIGRPSCFSYQLRKCQGACIHKETTDEYNTKVSEALREFKQDAWPFKGSIAIQENMKFLIFNNWRYIATIDNLGDFDENKLPENHISNDKDCYLILRNYLKKPNTAIHDLNNNTQVTQ